MSKPFGCSTCFDSVTNFFCVFSLNSIHKFQKQVFFVFVFHCPNHLGTPPASTVSPVVCEVSFLGPREPLVLPLVDPPVPKKNLDHLYTGIYALCIIRRLIKPTQWPMGSPRRPPNPLALPINPLGRLNRSLGLIEVLRSPQLPYKSSEDPSNVMLIL